MHTCHEFRSEGWNTFDVRSLAGIVHFPTMLEVRIGLMSAAGEPVWREFRWPQMARLGPHTPDCSYAAVDVEVPECRLLVEFASEQDRMAVRATVTDSVAHVRPMAEAFLYRGAPGEIRFEDSVARAHIGSDTLQLSCPKGSRHEQWAFEGTATFAAEHGEHLIVVASPDPRSWPPDEAYDFLNRRRQEAEAWERRFDDPDLQAAFEGAWRSVIWNTIYAPSIGRPVTVVSRDWCVDGNYGDFVLFEWDTFFAALQSAPASKELAYANVRAVLSGVTERRFVPSIFCELGRSRDRSMLPVGAQIVLKLYERFGEKDFLAEVFPTLLRWHDWWMTARDGNGDGLLEWGSDNFPSPHPQWQAHTLQAARYESGLDNSPMYDDAAFDDDANTMTQTDIGLNAAYAMDAWALARIASELGEVDAAIRLRNEHENIARLINDHLWSEDAGLYLNRGWDGRFSRRISPTSFYPLIGRVATAERARRIVEEHLLDEREFWGAHVIPSIARNDPAFADQEYWRGRIWGPMNWLVYEGLNAYGFDDVTKDMGRKCLRTFLAEWRDESHVHENYNGATGEGDDAQYSEPVYFWGGLLALIGLLESGQLHWADRRQANRCS